MIREVDLVSYLPTFMQFYKEPIETLAAENPEFILVWNGTDRILYNHFISTADEYGISRYEKILGIHPTSEDTLESRRSRVQSKWFTRTPYTINVLLQKLEILCGDSSFILSHNFTEGYTLTIVTELALYGQVEELDYMLSYMIPANIKVTSNNVLHHDADGKVILGGTTVETSYFNITSKTNKEHVVTGFIRSGSTVTTVIERTIN